MNHDNTVEEQAWKLLQEHARTKTPELEPEIQPDDEVTMEQLAEKNRIRQERLAVERAEKEQAEQEKIDAALTTKNMPSKVAFGLRKKRLFRPEIPTREQAAADGCVLPVFNDFLLMTRGYPELNVIELPDLPDQKIVEAYNLLPAFMADYSQNYRRHGFKFRPQTILNQWIKLLDPSESAMKDNLYIYPWELRFVVEEMANPKDGSKPQMFNPKNMVAIAARLRNQDQASGDRLIEKAMYAFADRHPYDYHFYRSVSPYRVIQTLDTCADWCELAQYPAEFPDDIVPYKMQLSINWIVQFRFSREQEDGFTSIAARYLTTLMLQAAGFAIRNGYKTPTEKSLFDLAHRYSIDYIQMKHPHDNPYATKNAYKKIGSPTR